MFCSNCGNQLADDAKFCGKCGTPVDTFNEPVAAVPVQPMVNTYEQPVPVQVEPVQVTPVQPVQVTPVQPIQPVPVQPVQPEPVQVNLVKEEPVQPTPAADPYEQPVPVENPYEQPVPAANPFEQPVADPFAQTAPVQSGNPFDQSNQAENPFAANTPVQSGNPFGDVTVPQQPGSFVPTQPMDPFGAAPEQMNQFENRKSKARKQKIFYVVRLMVIHFLYPFRHLHVRLLLRRAARIHSILSSDNGIIRHLLASVLHDKNRGRG